MQSVSKWMTMGAVALSMAVAFPAAARGRGGGWCGAAGSYRCLAQGGPGMGRGSGPRAGMGMGPRGDGLADPELLESVAAEIGVNDATLQKIKDLVYAANKEAIDLRAELAREHLTLRQMLDESTPDAKKAGKQVETVGAVETKLRKNRVQLLLSVRELLTPEQRAKLQRVLAERRGPGRGLGRGPGPGPGAGPGPGPGWGGGPWDLDD